MEDFSKDLTVVKSNKITEASYKLSVNEYRLILLCLGQLELRYDPERKDCWKQVDAHEIYEVSAKDFSNHYDLHMKEGYKVLREASENLLQRYVRIKIKDDDDPKSYLLTNWLASCKYSPTHGKIKLRFAPDMIPFLSCIKEQFTRYRLIEIAGLKSIYGMRLYEMLTQWKKSKGVFTINTEDLRRRLQLNKGQYKLFKDFRVYCVEKGINDINSNKNSLLQIEKVSYIKQGRKVVSIEMHFCEKGKITSKKATSKFKEIRQNLDQKTLSNELKKIQESLSESKKKNTFFSEETLEIPLQ